MRYNHKQSEVAGFSAVEIRVPIKQGGQKRDLPELFRETTQALKDKCNLNRDRLRLLHCENEEGVLALKYEILRKPKPIIEK